MAMKPLPKGCTRVTLPDGYTIDVPTKDLKEKDFSHIGRKYTAEIDTFVTGDDGQPTIVKLYRIPSNKTNDMSDEIRQFFGKEKRYR